MRYLKPRGRPVSLSPLRASLSSPPPPPLLPRFIPRFRYFSLTGNTRLVSKRLTKLLIYSSNLPVPCRIKRQGVFPPPPPPRWDASPSQGPPPSILSIFVLCEASQTIHRYPLILLGVEKHDERKCLAQEHKTLTWPGLEPRPQNLESSALTIRPPNRKNRATSTSSRIKYNVGLQSHYGNVVPPITAER